MWLQFYCFLQLVQKRLRQRATNAVTFCGNNLVFQMPSILLEIGCVWLERHWRLGRSSFLHAKDER
jgi:hypothetical protein